MDQLHHLPEVFETLYDTETFDTRYCVVSRKEFGREVPLYEPAHDFDKYAPVKDITNRNWSENEEFVLAILVEDRDTLSRVFSCANPYENIEPVYVYYTFKIEHTLEKGRSLYLLVPEKLGQDNTLDTEKTLWKKQFCIPAHFVKAHWDAYMCYYMYARKTGMCVEYTNMRVSGTAAVDNYLNTEVKDIVLFDPRHLGRDSEPLWYLLNHAFKTHATLVPDWNNTHHFVFRDNFNILEEVGNRVEMTFDYDPTNDFIKEGDDLSMMKETAFYKENWDDIERKNPSIVRHAQKHQRKWKGKTITKTRGLPLLAFDQDLDSDMDDFQGRYMEAETERAKEQMLRMNEREKRLQAERELFEYKEKCQEFCTQFEHFKKIRREIFTQYELLNSIIETQSDRHKEELDDMESNHKRKLDDMESNHKSEMEARQRKLDKAERDLFKYQGDCRALQTIIHRRATNHAKQLKEKEQEITQQDRMIQTLEDELLRQPRKKHRIGF